VLDTGHQVVPGDEPLRHYLGYVCLECEGYLGRHLVAQDQDVLQEVRHLWARVLRDDSS
jgi:hypothetical protein